MRWDRFMATFSHLKDWRWWLREASLIWLLCLSVGIVTGADLWARLVSLTMYFHLRGYFVSNPMLLKPSDLGFIYIPRGCVVIPSEPEDIIVNDDLYQQEDTKDFYITKERYDATRRLL